VSKTSTTRDVAYRGYQMVVSAIGRKTVSCKVKLAGVGISKELGNIKSAKDWVRIRENQPMELREPFADLV
jgi:hypothetical protein